MERINMKRIKIVMGRDNRGSFRINPLVLINNSIQMSNYLTPIK